MSQEQLKTYKGTFRDSVKYYNAMIDDLEEYIERRDLVIQIRQNFQNIEGFEKDRDNIEKMLQEEYSVQGAQNAEELETKIKYFESELGRLQALARQERQERVRLAHLSQAKRARHEKRKQRQGNRKRR